MPCPFQSDSCQINAVASPHWLLFYGYAERHFRSSAMGIVTFTGYRHCAVFSALPRRRLMLRWTGLTVLSVIDNSCPSVGHQAFVDFLYQEQAFGFSWLLRVYVRFRWFSFSLFNCRLVTFTSGIFCYCIKLKRVWYASEAVKNQFSDNVTKCLDII
jgi:hypothetical protein